MDQDGVDRNAVLGRGIAFPLELAGGSVGLNAYESQVAQSIRLILGTGRGERVMRPDFGGNLHRLAFEPLNPVTLTLVQHQVRDTLVQFEPRIDVLDVVTQPQSDASLLLVEIRYRVRQTDSVFNMVYPFYLDRGER
jgi:phage baseplate assembly protein W